MKKWSIRIFLVLAGMLVLGAAAFLIYAQFQYSPSSVLKEQVDLASIETKEEGLLFQPDEPNGKGVIFYQGAKVQEEAYAYLAEKLSAEGFLVVIPQLPLNFGILDVNKADAAIDSHPEIEEWFIGGHSLGGVAAAMYAENKEDKVAGLYFLASYPAGDFSSTELPMLSIYAEKDGLLTTADIEKNRKGFSPDSRFVEIAGGNHAQFGLYGKQKGDNEATIAPLDQQNQVAEALLAWMNEN
ncbi:alpha/beta hydrolase [Planococcus sp. N028]|uniref:Alpha/beta hydrolase n=1 Tax=Planococcus shixiaomingii TaxID=3058393 RepID=A0ABT8N6J4_9BACL|nr:MULTISPECIES: alpha/beta hydrolase [unclassified Planococcus (in: firmicutes)]MDN7243277.1 alpha/beta hydrolase [Planococcus sp. N028]WKA55219.1 alpha/beta hydrolase [Planococcus sp. N022]